MLRSSWKDEFCGAYDASDLWTLHALRVEAFRDTIQVVKSGGYTVDGVAVRLSSEEMMLGTVMYTDPGEVTVPEASSPTIIEVKDSDTLLAGKALLEEGYNAAVLNFANRQTPGGGVEHGSGAQEENIFRRSDLFQSLYQFHCNGELWGVPQRPERYPMDKNTGGAYSPNVTVFRGMEREGYPLLKEPYRLGVVTVAALNRPALESEERLAASMTGPTRLKMRTILRIALKHGHDGIVLGAWGCGAFKNPPAHIARLFHETLEEPEFRNRFRKVVFAVMDKKLADFQNGKKGNLGAFQAEFA